MTLSTELNRVVLLRGTATEQARSPWVPSDLSPSPFGGRFQVDRRVVDPKMVAAVAQAEERARVAGWERGRQEGRESARQEAAEQEQARVGQARDQQDRRDQAWSRAVEAMGVSLADLDARDAPVFADLERSVAIMAVQIAEVLVGRHLELGKWSALDAVQRALALVPRLAEVIVRVHPGAAAELLDVAATTAGRTSVTVVSDPSIELGGCIVEAGNRTIDAQLGAALQRLHEVLA